VKRANSFSACLALPYLLPWVRVLLLIRSITSTTWGHEAWHMARSEARAPPRTGDAPADRQGGLVELDAYGDFMASCADTRLLSNQINARARCAVAKVRAGCPTFAYSSQRYASSTAASIVRHRPPDTLIPSERPSTVLLPMRSVVDVV